MIVLQHIIHWPHPADFLSDPPFPKLVGLRGSTPLPWVLVQRPIVWWEVHVVKLVGVAAKRL